MSWIGVKGRDREAVFADLQLVDTGRADPERRARFSWAELPSGWLLIHSNDLEYAAPKRIRDLSIGGEAIGCAIEEHVMFSGLRGYRDGTDSWWVIHDAQGGIFDLSTGGNTPPQLAEIEERLTREQRAEGGSAAGVDLIFDIPVELAQALCGFRHDGREDGEPEPAFTEAKGPSRAALSGRRGRVTFGELLGRLFGRG